MRMLFIGDVTASVGRGILEKLLPELLEEYAPDLIIANVENAAHGLGITPKIADRFIRLGIDVLTGGNHIYDRKEILDYLPNQPRLLKPANYPRDTPGHAVYIGEAGGAHCLVATLVGRTFMPPNDSPFMAFDRLVNSVGADIDVRIIDFHAEATSEKVAFARYVDSRASAVIGTHTHVQTADEQILPGGTAFITDVGMTGPHDGIIGMSSDTVLRRFLTGMPTHFEPAEGDARLHAVIVDIDQKSGRALSIERISRSRHSE